MHSYQYTEHKSGATKQTRQTKQTKQKKQTKQTRQAMQTKRAITVEWIHDQRLSEVIILASLIG